MRHALLTLSLASLCASTALAEAPQFKLPPSDDWTEADDVDDGSGLESARFFTLTKDPSVTLRVGWSPEVHPKFTSELMMELARTTAKAAKGRDMRVTDATTINVKGTNVGVMRFNDKSGKAMQWFLPGEDTEIIVVLRKKGEGWNRTAENEVGNAVSLATNLRGKPPPGEADFALYGGIGAVVIIGGALAFAVFRRPKASAPAPAKKAAPTGKQR